MMMRFIKWIFDAGSGELLRIEWRETIKGPIVTERKAAHYEGPFYVYPDNDR